jgi:hypothetical protein
LQLNQPHKFFLFFLPSKIRVSPTGVVSSLSLPRCLLSSGRYHHATAPYHDSFLWSQDELVASASSFNNDSYRLLSQVKTEAFNQHHRRRPPSLNSSTLTMHYYKNVISILATLPTAQSRLHFVSFLTRAPHHWSSTHHRHSLSPSSHTLHSSLQRHPR